MLRLASDENLDGDIVRGLRLHRPGLDLIRVQEAGLRGEDDPAVLAWAAEEGRILVSHDRATLPGFAHARVDRGAAMPGVFILNDRIPVRQAIDELLLIDSCSEQEQWEGLVLSLPL